MSFELNDPSIVSATKDETTNSIAGGSLNDITKFLQNIKENQDRVTKSETKTTEDVSETLNPKSIQVNVPKFHSDYKPNETEKQYVYSVNELLDLSRSVPQTLTDEITSKLPKKNFWRLTNRYPDQNNNKSHTYKSTDGNFDRKNHRNRGNRNNGNRRNSKFSKGDKQYVEEKDVEVNNDDLLALEEEIHPTGNSISDFENWRAKMKELERRKKGLPPLDSTDAPIERPGLGKNTSSISDFFNLKKEDSSLFEELEPADRRSDTPKGSSSRFSSFFHSASSSSNSIVQEKVVAQPPTPKQDDARPAAGSRILSFFSNEKSETDGSNNSTPQPRMVKNITPMGNQSNTTIQESPAIAQVPAAPVQIQSNDNFFQNLLSKGKPDEGVPQLKEQQSPEQEMKQLEGNRQFRRTKSDVSVPSPSTQSQSQPRQNGSRGVSRPQQNQQQQLPLTQQQGRFAMGSQMPVPPHMIPPMGQGIPMPPPGFTGFQGPPPPGIPGQRVQQFFGNQQPQQGKQTRNDQPLSHGNVSRERQRQQRQVPPQFMPAPGGMPPPGFPLMQPPPGFSPNMPVVPNGMAPPQGFFPPQPPVSFLQFGHPQMANSNVPPQMAPQQNK